MNKWEIVNKLQHDIDDVEITSLIDILLENRGIKTTTEKKEFLNPNLKNLTTKKVGIDEKNMKLAISRIKNAINKNERIIVFGDYDVDGITGSAILWETLHGLGAKTLPYIPHRIDEGYGLSEAGIKNVLEKNPDTKLIITIDNGIVANKTVDFAKSKGIDVIITDHHVPGEALPNAYTIVHTTNLCGAGVAYVLSQEIKYELTGKRDNDEDDIHLELASLGTIADLVPLTNANRIIVKHGLLQLGRYRRLGLTELCKIANLAKEMFTVYDVGYVIAPRLNAAGRIESAMDSLRLLCTKDNARARMLAQKLEEINTERQNILKASAEQAKSEVRSRKNKDQKLIFVASENFQQGVIGLVAGKLVEEFYRPSIVVSIGKEKSKGSVRSVSGFNIIDFLRSHKEFFSEVGGHPMAAGFSVSTKKLPELQKALENSANKIITPDVLNRTLKIDCELPTIAITNNLYKQIQTLAPFGMGNPEPTFVSYSVEVKNFKLLGRERNHLKLELGIKNPSLAKASEDKQESRTIEAIGFGMSEFADHLKPGDQIDIVYTIDNNTWNGNTKLQLKIKDTKLHE
jgi:single-stranded-DNA-specific exonuclease